MAQIVKALADLLSVSPNKVRVTLQPRRSAVHDVAADALIEAGPFTFVVEWKGVAGAGAVAWAAKQARQYVRQLGKAAIPLVAVPFMGQVGSQVCEEAGVAWLDLSGNARIIAPGLRIVVEGKPNRFVRRGRPVSAFAPKSSRIARWLLMHQEQSFTQREIAEATEMDEGFTSRIVTRLEEDELVTRNYAGAIKPRDPDLLLDAWREEYDFSKHHIIAGHIPAQSGDALLRQIVAVMTKASIPYAATGLAASWLLDHFAGFRIVTVYVPEEPSPKLLESISFHEDERGANVWLAVPNDAGVFHEAKMHDKVRCVHPVQVYLDLKGHPERSQEAAEKLRANHLKWKKDGG
ncbi:MAG TPA: type IV toxin-antitoxin system AbiEi family antitoxin [bacterium]|nr:type IV toxin-antitoxin system AbiEi family antitoxin [bacterium]